MFNALKLRLQRFLLRKCGNAQEERKLVIQRQIKRWEELEESDALDFLKKAEIVFNDSTFQSVIAYLALDHNDRAALETKSWEETLCQRSMAQGVMEVYDEFDKLKAIYKEKTNKKPND